MRLTGQNMKGPPQLKLEMWSTSCFDLPTVFTEWASLAQDRAGWNKFRDHAPLRHWKALRAATTGRHQDDSGGQAPSSGQRAAEVAERRAVLDANNNN